LKLNYVLSTFAAFLNVDTLTLRALILTVVWQCSYMDVWGYYEHDQMVRWFLGRPLSKSELHRRAKRLGGKGGLPGVRQGAGGGAGEAGGLPAQQRHPREALGCRLVRGGGPLRQDDRETLRKKFEVSLRQGKVREAAELLYLVLRSKVGRRFKGEFTKKRNRSHFGFKILVAISPPCLSTGSRSSWPTSRTTRSPPPCQDTRS
jgi:hypothetical protein